MRHKPEINLQWFHVFVSFVDSEEFTDMSGSEVKVFLVVKRHTDFDNAISRPTVRQIMKRAGIKSEACVKALANLEKKGIIRKIREGRSNYYEIVEKFRINDQESASFSYARSSVKKATTELAEYVNAGQVAPAEGFKFIHIDKVENLTINIFNGETKVETTVFEHLSDEKSKIAMELADKVGKGEIRALDAVRILKGEG